MSVMLERRVSGVPEEGGANQTLLEEWLSPVPQRFSNWQGREFLRRE
jgi:hypothetical protein